MLTGSSPNRRRVHLGLLLCDEMLLRNGANYATTNKESRLISFLRPSHLCCFSWALRRQTFIKNEHSVLTPKLDSDDPHQAALLRHSSEPVISWRFAGCGASPLQTHAAQEASESHSLGSVQAATAPAGVAGKQPRPQQE